jgi:hypothetical protein
MNSSGEYSPSNLDGAHRVYSEAAYLMPEKDISLFAVTSAMGLDKNR